MPCALVERLQMIADPRRQNEKLKHRLVDLIIVGFCGVLAGCEDFVEIAEWPKCMRSFALFLSCRMGFPPMRPSWSCHAQPNDLARDLTAVVGERRGLPGD
jgi:hypothetical protein